MFTITQNNISRFTSILSSILSDYTVKSREEDGYHIVNITVNSGEVVGIIITDKMLLRIEQMDTSRMNRFMARLASSIEKFIRCKARIVK